MDNKPTINSVHRELARLLDEQGGVVTAVQALAVLTRSELATYLKHERLQRIWHGIYCRDQTDRGVRLRGLDLFTGTTVAVCLATAAAAYRFDTEQSTDLHVLNPPGRQLRSTDGLVVHRREGAPLTLLGGRPATEPAWTAIEVARGLRRPRALASLDAALRSGTCSRDELRRAVDRQAGRRGIVAARDLLPLASPLSESPMESEARLVMVDGGLPAPLLQYEIVDNDHRVWRLDFAWPDHRLAVEYDGVDWHSGPEAFRRDRARRAALEERGWTVLAIVADDVRRRPDDMVRRIRTQLARAEAA